MKRGTNTNWTLSSSPNQS